MKTYYRNYSVLVICCFLAYVFLPSTAMAQSFDDFMESGLSQEVLQGLFNSSDPISDQSDAANLSQTEIAPPPMVITTSGGDIYLLQGDGVKAKLKIDQQGTLETTYSLDGSDLKMINEFGEEFHYEYSRDGQTVQILNANDEVIATHSFELGKVTAFSSQGKITYQYANDGSDRMISSTDEWGNVTNYDDLGRPATITDSKGVVVGQYKFDNKGKIETFTDHNGSVTVFDSEGLRPLYTKNAQGTKTQEYRYDSTGHLTAVLNNVNGQMTEVENGYYTIIYNTVEATTPDGTVITDDEGNPILEYVATGVYSYDAAGNVEAINDVGPGGIITGWTEYDDYGRVSATYNAEGTKIQEYAYNQHGFLEMTISLGSVDALTGQQTMQSYTVFDGHGRPSEVWQIGDTASDKVKIQEYTYKADGLLDVTYSLGIKRDDLGNAILDDAGEYVYITTSKTVYDTKGRPNAVYGMVRDESGEIVNDDMGNPILEVQQKYTYDNKGFLSKTTSYGFGGIKTGETVFDAYSRPTESFNSSGALTQTYTYGNDGFLKETSNYGENGAFTGYTLYDAKGKPTDVYNHEGSLTQKYIYDQNGLLLMSLSLSAEAGGNDAVVATLSDKMTIAQLWNSEWDSQYDFLDPDNQLTSEHLIAEAWSALESGDTEKAKAFSLKCIQTFSADATSQQKQNDSLPAGPAIFDNWALNDVGTGYFILGQALETEGSNDAAASAYKIQAAEFEFAQCWDPAEGSFWVVSDGSKVQLNADHLNVNTSVVTGYTLFGGDSKPIASYQFYEKFDENGASLGVQETKVQEYVYTYQANVKVIDPVSGETSTVAVTKNSGFVQKTVNFGDIIDQATGEQEVTGYTTFDKLGRQDSTFNSDDQLVQSYKYSGEGFLKYTYSYGANKAKTGTTLFDHYSRPVASFNMAGTEITKIPQELIRALGSGLTEADLANQDWQPYLKGLNQTFEYDSNGFLSSSKSYGEGLVLSTSQISGLVAAMGSSVGDAAYDVTCDYNEDGTVNYDDMVILNEAFDGAEMFANTYGSKAGDGNYFAQYDYDSDGDVDKKDLSSFGKTFEKSTEYRPTWTGVTNYDKYGKADTVMNVIEDASGNQVEGVLVQKYEYNERGFMERSVSYGILTDDQGNVIKDGENPISIATGFTQFDAGSRPVATYSLYDDGLNGLQESKIQEYVYDKGFLTQTVNFGDIIDQSTGELAKAGYTNFDNFGRQTTSYNEEGQKTTVFKYSIQGFMSETYNYGSGGAYLGKTVFNKAGRPTEAYNMYASKSGTQNGLTQKFNYNEYGFMSHSESFGQDQTLTSTTYYNGHGKGLRVENEKGFVISSYQYNERGFMEKTQSLAFIEVTDPAEIANLQSQGLYVQETAIDDNTGEAVTQGGFYAVTGYTTFDANSRPTESYQCYWTTQGEGQGVKVQEYVYKDGFLVETLNFGRPEGGEQRVVGTTSFDKFGRQSASYNELGQVTTKYQYSNQGFLSGTTNHGEKGVKTGSTEISALGRPTAAYNHKGTLVQAFGYDSVTGQLTGSTSYGEPDPDTGDPTMTGTTTYDAYGKATGAYNDMGAKVQEYVYDPQGFMVETLSLGDDDGSGNPVITGRTVYDDASKPVESYTRSSSGVETRVQVFVYNTAVDLSNYADYVANPDNYSETKTGFLSSTFSHGKDNYLSGYTKFNQYGQQTNSYNEFNELTVAYKYSGSGFMNESWSYGLNSLRTGKTVYSSSGRPEASYNEKGAVVQQFNYNANGFMASTTSFGDVGDDGNPTQTQTTYYDGYGKQTHSMNTEGSIVQTFQYDDAGFLLKSQGWAQYEGVPDGLTWYEVLDQGYAVETSYTTYDNASRPVESYIVYQGDSGRREVKTQSFIYNTGVDSTNYQDYLANPDSYSGTQTGFMTQSVSYTLNNDENGAPVSHEANGGRVANAVGTEVVVSGLTTYNSFGRPDKTYNHLGQVVSVSSYNANGFLKETQNFGENGAYSGKLIYNAAGRPTEAYNNLHTKVTEYIYNDQGVLSQTVSFNQGLVTQYTTYDIYSKAIESRQCFTAGETTHNFPNSTGYQFGEGQANYSVAYNDDGSISEVTGGALSQQSFYNEFGFMKASVSYGRTGQATSYVVFDKYQRPTEVYNITPDAGANRDAIMSSIIVQSEVVLTGAAAEAHNSARVQKYNYNEKGFLVSTISYQRTKEYDDQGNPLSAETWEKESSITYYNTVGQQTSTYLLKDDGTDGAKQATYTYNNQGFLTQAVNYNGNTRTGYTEYDASGRQVISYNASNSPVNKYWYDLNGFLIGNTNVQ
ncbi:MAG: hypothetical protein ABII88_11185 [Candidatus Omnitrophota bacterium]